MKNNWPLIALIFAGLVLIGGSLFFLNKPATPNIDTSLAIIEPLFGKAEILRKSLSSKESIVGPSQLYSLDSVEIDGESEALLIFKNGYRLSMASNTSFTINKEDANTIIVLRRGKIDIETEGNGDDILISKNGVRWTLKEYSKFAGQSSFNLSSDSTPEKDSEGIQPQTSNSPTPEYVASVLTGYRDAFQRCYAQLILRNPEARGDCALSFTLLKNGKTDEIKTVSCSMNDTAFDKCLHEILKRAQFRSFQGPSVKTVFPLKFE